MAKNKQNEKNKPETRKKMFAIYIRHRVIHINT